MPVSKKQVTQEERGETDRSSHLLSRQCHLFTIFAIAAHHGVTNFSFPHLVTSSFLVERRRKSEEEEEEGGDEEAAKRLNATAPTLPPRKIKTFYGHAYYVRGVLGLLYFLNFIKRLFFCSCRRKIILCIYTTLLTWPSS